VPDDPLSLSSVITRFGWPTVMSAPLWPGWNDVLVVAGYSTPNLRGMLNNLCRFDGCNYLEVGTLHGGTLAAASYDNPGTFIGIDNFSQFRGDRDRLEKTFAGLQPHCHVRFLERNCLTVDLLELPTNVNVLFYDADHSEECTRDTIIRFDPLLADKFLLIVDDYSWLGPRRGAEGAIQRLNWNVHLRIGIEDNYSRRGWGVGLLIVLAEKRKT
jgi:hypothetical protein